MDEKRPIDRIRESSGQADIGSIEDGAIVEMKNIGGKLLIIKEKSIYEMVFADAVDPNRTNINLPPTIHKLIIDKGIESETVSRTFLTAKTLFRPEYFSNSINCDKVLGLTIDMLSEISILEKEIAEVINDEDTVSINYEKRRNQKSSYEIPSVVNLESRCKTIFQKADHIEQTLIEIIINFYPNDGLKKQSRFPNFLETIKLKHGDNDSFTYFISKTIFFMRVMRELRNGFDHRLETVKVTNFEIQSDGNILSPTVELNHKEIKLPRTSLKEFLTITNSNLLEIIETTFAFLASRNAKNHIMAYEVREIPEEKRRYKYVRYCFWSPLGQDGYYNQ